MTINFKIKEKEEYTIVHSELGGNVTPEILKTIKPPKVRGTKGVVLSGRGPIWLYCYLAHYYHPTMFIATYDPRIGGAIVVESHNRTYCLGDVIKVDSDEL